MHGQCPAIIIATWSGARPFFPVKPEAHTGTFARRRWQLLEPAVKLVLHPNEPLLFENQRRPADTLCMQVNCYLNAVGDPKEGNAAVNPIVFAVKRHRALDFP